MPAVSVVRCERYDRAQLEQALRKALEPFGSIASIVKPGARVLLKINHLGRHAPETAVDTHPELLRAVIELVQTVTPNVTVADGLWNAGLDDFEVSGTAGACRETGATLVNLTGHGYREVRRDGLEAVKSLPFAEPALDADVVINLPKLKTHALCLMTCAVKNSYGFLPRQLKVNFHRIYGDPDQFANMLVDVWQARPPELTIVDAVTAMEGNGPSSDGRPKDLGLIIAGRDAVAIDAVAAALMGLGPNSVASTRHAARRGLGEADLAKIQIVGEPIARARQRFELPAATSVVELIANRLPKPVLRLLARVLMSTRVYPRIVESRCTGCGLCVHHCPAAAVRVVGSRARIDRAKCVACFCCQEFCEQAAVDARPSGFGALVTLPFRVLGTLAGGERVKDPNERRRKPHG